MRRLAFLILMVLPGLAPAQNRTDSLKREVTIEKDFTPIVRDASKINTLPKVEVPSVTRQAIRYSDWAAPSSWTPYAVTLAPGGFGDKPRMPRSRGYLDFALGNYWNMAGNAGYRILQNERDRLGLWLQHRSTSGRVDYHRVDAELYPRSDKMKQLSEQAAIDYTHRFDRLLLDVDMGYRYDTFNYYGLRYPGLADIFSTSQAINRLFAKSRIASTGDGKPFSYKASLAYYRYGYAHGYLQGKAGASENLVEAEFSLSAPAGEKGAICVDGVLDFVGYSRLAVSAREYGMLSLNPHYDWKNEQVNLKVGVKADISFGDGTIFRFAPDVRIDWFVAPDVDFYVNVGGGKSLNTWHKLSGYSLYFNPSMPVDNSYVPLDAFAGLRVDALPGISLGVWGGYEIGKNTLFLLPERQDGWLTGFSRYQGIDTDALKAGADVTYRYGSRLEISAKAEYHRWRDTREHRVVSYNQPRWTGTFELRYRPVDSLLLEAGYDLSAGRDYGPLGKLGDIHLVHVKASYDFTRRFSAYALIDNLLNRRYDILYGLPAQGIRVMAGIDFRF